MNYLQRITHWLKTNDTTPEEVSDVLDTRVWKNPDKVLYDLILNRPESDTSITISQLKEVYAKEAPKSDTHLIWSMREDTRRALIQLHRRGVVQMKHYPFLPPEDQANVDRTTAPEEPDLRFLQLTNYCDLRATYFLLKESPKGKRITITRDLQELKREFAIQ